MAVTYTEAALVKKRSNFISASLIDTDIEENIYQAESIIDSVMLKTARGATPDFTFDPTKHGMIRDCATDLATYFCITFDPSGFPSMETAEMVSNLLWNAIQMEFTLLADVKTSEFLEGL
jgi:hypothetical protein